MEYDQQDRSLSDNVPEICWEKKYSKVDQRGQIICIPVCVAKCNGRTLYTHFVYPNNFEQFSVISEAFDMK